MACKSRSVYNKLAIQYPDDYAFLNHKNPFELLIAVILSAQCTDERINRVTPTLFKRFPTPQSLADGPLDDIKDCIKSVNFYNNKSVNIQRTAQVLVDQFNSKVPNTIESLITLPGVGRKTANVMLCQAFFKPGVTVDTHVKRTTFRLGFHSLSDADKIEHELKAVWPMDIWSHFSTILILHGRETCTARVAHCDRCPVQSLCPQKGVSSC